VIDRARRRPVTEGGAHGLTADDPYLERFILLGPLRHLLRISPLGEVIVVGGRGDRQDAADRLDPKSPAMIVDERDRGLYRRSSSP